MQKEIGIDLGSSCLLVSTAEEGILFREPSVVAIGRESDRLLSIGQTAADNFAASPGSMRLIRPLRKGILSDPEATRTVLAHILRQTCGNLIIRPRVLIGIPFNFSEEEESLMEWTAARAGARETFLVYTPVAAMAGMELARDSAVLLADIGASQTSILLAAASRILYRNTVRVGGDSFDTAIASYLLDKHGIRISARSAEAVKLRIGTVWIHREDRKIDVRGKQDDSGESITVRVSSREMFDALEEPTACLLEAICDGISHIPSQYVGEVFRRGILLCGGGSCLDGLDKMIAGVTGVNARVVERPDEVTALGLGRILADLPTSMKNEKINISARILRAGV